jgi:CBS domain-containing protein
MSMSTVPKQNQKQNVRNLRLRTYTLVTNDGETFQPFVHCPHRNTTIDAFECKDCARMVMLEWDAARGGHVTCDVTEIDKNRAKAGQPPRQTPDRRADVGEAAIRTTLRDIVVSEDEQLGPFLQRAIAVGPDVTAVRLKQLLAKRNLRSVPVVDEDGKLQGIISRSDLMTASDSSVASEIMPKCIHALPEDAPLSYAIALLAFENVSEVPIVTEDGTVVGICHALDILRWLATRIGYVAPAATAAR